MKANDSMGITDRLLNGNAGAWATRNSNLTIANATNTNVTWNVQTQDDDAWFAPTSADITVPDSGWYIITGGIDWSGIVVGDRVRQWFTVNGNNLGAVEDDVAGIANPTYNLAQVAYLTANDVIRLRVFHNGGAGVAVAGNETSFLSVARAW